MSPTPLLIVVLLVTTVAAILAGMAVFTNVRPEKPDDPRIGQMFESIEEIKGMVNQIQKSLLTIEHKMEKDVQGVKGDIKENIDRAIEAVDKMINPDQGQ
jgi:hypothetical protein